MVVLIRADFSRHVKTNFSKCAIKAWFSCFQQSPVVATAVPIAALSDLVVEIAAGPAAFCSQVALITGDIDLALVLAEVALFFSTPAASVAALSWFKI